MKKISAGLRFRPLVKALYLIATLLVLSACTYTKVKTHEANGYTFRTFHNRDHSRITYAKVSDSIAVVFKDQPPTGDPGPTKDEWECLLCIITHIRECADKVCPGNEGNCSDAIRDCTNEKCNNCRTSPRSWGVIRIL